MILESIIVQECQTIRPQESLAQDFGELDRIFDCPGEFLLLKCTGLRQLWKVFGGRKKLGEILSPEIAQGNIPRALRSFDNAHVVHVDRSEDIPWLSQQVCMYQRLFTFFSMCSFAIVQPLPEEFGVEQVGRGYSAAKKLSTRGVVCQQDDVPVFECLRIAINEQPSCLGSKPVLAWPVWVRSEVFLSIHHPSRITYGIVICVKAWGSLVGRSICNFENKPTERTVSPAANLGQPAQVPDFMGVFKVGVVRIDQEGLDFQIQPLAAVAKKGFFWSVSVILDQSR